MTVAEFLEKYENVIKFIDDNHILSRDVKYISLSKEAKEMMADGMKMDYVTSCLADKYNITDRTVYAVIKRLSTEL